jgi:hypothetical protein
MGYRECMGNGCSWPTLRLFALVLTCSRKGIDSSMNAAGLLAISAYLRASRSGSQGALVAGHKCNALRAMCDPGAASVRDHSSTRWVSTFGVPIATRDPIDECRSTRTTYTTTTRRMDSEPASQLRWPGRASWPTIWIARIETGVRCASSCSAIPNERDRA